MLQHVSIEIPPEEAERAVEFWSLIGFGEVSSPEPLGGSVRWLEREGTQIHLILTEAHTAPVLGHAAVVVEDHAGAVGRLREAGFEVEDGRQLWGADRAFAIGPGGHRVELMAAPPPTGAACASAGARRAERRPRPRSDRS